MVQFFLNLAHFLQSGYHKKVRVKRPRNVKYLFYRNNDYSKLSIRAQNQRRIYSLWTHFNNSREALLTNFQQIYSLGSFVFLQHIIFMVQNIISRSEHNCGLKQSRRNKQKTSAGKKIIGQKQTILQKVCNLLRKIFYCIRRCFIMWDVQSHCVTRRSRNDLESGCS